MADPMKTIDLGLFTCPGCGVPVKAKTDVHYTIHLAQDGEKHSVKATITPSIGRVRVEHVCLETRQERNEASVEQLDGVLGAMFGKAKSEGDEG